ncbi:MAG: alpha/beta fold hydrolase, partial [Candidatus Eremiobacteraeota bacterium]|nr:alpha/beta fold hydrolase [Candidatus Eremiobacteraeota bacterium]
MNRVLNALLIAVLGSSFAFFSPTAGGAQSLVPSPVATFDVGTLHVDEFGHGAQTLILIPGLGSGSWAWDGTIARFSSHYTIYVLTLPGFDGRAATKESPLFAAFAGDFWKLLADRKIDKPLVIGHSLGGTLAFLLAEEHPERLRAIVAVDGLPIFPAVANATADQRLAAADKMAATLES